MRSALNHFTSDRPGELFQRRTLALALVIAAHIGLVILLLRLAPPVPMTEPAVATFELIPEPEPERERKVAKPKRRTTAPSPAKPTVPIVEPPYELPIIPLTKEQFAAADIAKLPSHSRADSADTGAESATADSAIGGSPNGQRLHDVAWQRRPTRAELTYYLPDGAPRDSWAVIACQTIPDYRVDNCHEIDESPAGSRLASAIRQAAWQFRVLPPRINGRPILGAWVRIRIEFSERAAD